MSSVVVHDGAIHPGGAVKVVLETCHALDADLVVGISGMDRSWWESRVPESVRLLSKNSKMGTVQDIRNVYRMLRLSLNEYDMVVTSGPAAKFYQPYDRQTHVHYLHHPPLAKLWFDGGLFAYAQGFIDRVETVSIPIVVANSELTAERYWKHYGRSIDHVVNPPVDTDSFSGDREHSPGKFVMVGRLEGRKRPFLAVEAFSRLAKDGLQELPELHFVGDGPLRDEIRHTAPKNVHVHGYVEDHELRAIVESSDIGIFLPEREDFGITPIEYMAAGLPVLAVDEPNTNNLVENGFTGLLVGPDPDAVADGVLRMMNHDWDREAITEEAERYRTYRFQKQIREVVADV